jgi:hypothetical protein
MKKLIAVFVAALLVASAAPSLAAWPRAVGKRCWTADGDPTSVVTLRIEPKGSGFYEVMGKLMSGGVLRNVFTGTVIKNGTSFVLNASQTGSDEPGAVPKDLWGGLMKCLFDQSTLTAACEEISFLGNNSTGVTTEFHTHTLTPRPCR